jgi:type I restriction enzyme, S subunit
MSEGVTRKDGWTTVAFGEVVRLSTERSNKSESDGFEWFIGLEHLEPGDLRIRGRGDIADGTTFTRVFRPGQVLFGKRRAYQRKVAVADFSGVCSGDIYVFEPKDDGLLPELLPFICQTDAFFEHAVGTSAGSLSPRTNWSSLAGFEFALPPIEEQRRIARILTSANALRMRLDDLARASEAVERAASLREFSETSHGITPSAWKPTQWDLAPLASLVAADSPICYGIVQVGNYVKDGVPTLAIKDLDGDFVKNVHRTSNSVETTYRRSRVVPGDVLLSIKGTVGEVAVVPSHFQGNISRDLARLRLDTDHINPRFFLHLYRSPMYQRYVTSVVVGTTRAELSIGALRKLAVPLPDLADQGAIVRRLDQLVSATAAARQRAEIAARLLRRLIGRCLALEDGQ